MIGGKTLLHLGTVSHRRTIILQLSFQIVNSRIGLCCSIFYQPIVLKMASFGSPLKLEPLRVLSDEDQKLCGTNVFFANVRALKTYSCVC
jgi:hypothetical protein